MAEPLVSVIIPTYARPEFLPEAISSVLRQTVGDLECLVVDDASPQPVQVPADDRIRLIRHQVNRGEAAARNTGLDEARGRYITFLDDDDLYTSERLAIGLEGTKRAPVSVCWRRGLLDGSEGSNHVYEGDVSDVILNQLTPNMGQIIMRRDLAPRVDERFKGLADLDWLLRTAQQAPFATDPRIGYLWRSHPGFRHSNGLVERVRHSLILFDKHRDYFAEHPRAAAFRWKRMGLMANLLGDYAVARRAFLRSMRLEPDAKTAWHLLRSCRPSSTTAEGVAL